MPQALRHPPTDQSLIQEGALRRAFRNRCTFSKLDSPLDLPVVEHRIRLTRHGIVCILDCICFARMGCCVCRGGVFGIEGLVDVIELAGLVSSALSHEKDCLMDIR